jgi:hypothetical protein
MTPGAGALGEQFNSFIDTRGNNRRLRVQGIEDVHSRRLIVESDCRGRIIRDDLRKDGRAVSEIASRGEKVVSDQCRSGEQKRGRADDHRDGDNLS